MARNRKKSWTARVLVLGILVLAAFGGMTLYKQNRDQVDAGVHKVSKKVRQVSEALSE